MYLTKNPNQMVGWIITGVIMCICEKLQTSTVFCKVLDFVYVCGNDDLGDARIKEIL